MEYLKEAETILKNTFGYQEFRGRQKPVIENVFKNNDSLVLMPTGGGKSLCYQIPAIVKNGLTLVISPLIALMQDQVDALLQIGVSAASLNSQTTDTADLMYKLKNNQINLLYIAPERAVNPSFINFILRFNVTLLAIDEAHCVSQWGHDFRPEYMKLDELFRHLPQAPRIALTATANYATRQEIIKHLLRENYKEFVSSFDRPNIQYFIQIKDNPKKQLLNLIYNEFHNKPGIVYCLSRKTSEKIAEYLNDNKINALVYHAGLSQAMRSKNLKQFLFQDNIVMVATVAFGMGINKPNIRFVAHYDIPKDIESYYQETGRAGRDGLPAKAWLIYGASDVVSRQRMILTGEGDMDFKMRSIAQFNKLLGLCEISQCRRQNLLQYFSEASSDQCNNCDNCLTPPTLEDATLQAQQALSAVYRTGQRFGIAYICEILIGKISDKVKQNNHNQLQVFGIGKDLLVEKWRSLLRQLFCLNYLEVANEYGGLRLTQKAKLLFQNKEIFYLKTHQNFKKTQKKFREQKELPQDEFWTALKKCREDFALELKVSPFIVLSDDALQALYQLKPQTIQGFLNIYGIGEQRTYNYGIKFIKIIKQYTENTKSNDNLLNKKITETIQESVNLYNQLHDLILVANQRQLKENTILQHLLDATIGNAFDINLLFNKININEVDQKEILNQFLQNQNLNISAIYEQMNGKYTFTDLKIIRCKFIIDKLL